MNFSQTADKGAGSRLALLKLPPDHVRTKFVVLMANRNAKTTFNMISNKMIAMFLYLPTIWPFMNFYLGMIYSIHYYILAVHYHFPEIGAILTTK